MALIRCIGCNCNDIFFLCISNWHPAEHIRDTDWPTFFESCHINAKCAKDLAVHIVSGSLLFCLGDCCRCSRIGVISHLRADMCIWPVTQLFCKERLRWCLGWLWIHGRLAVWYEALRPRAWWKKLWRFGEVRSTRVCGRDPCEIMQGSCRCSARCWRVSERLAQRETRCQWMIRWCQLLS